MEVNNMEIRIINLEASHIVLCGDKWYQEYHYNYEDCDMNLEPANVAEIAKNAIAKLHARYVYGKKDISTPSISEFEENWKYKYKNRFSCVHDAESVIAGFIVNNNMVLTTLGGTYIFDMNHKLIEARR
jgi:hypothetical protein